ncbi:hypothetical protein VV01_04520 [Luteipulveratus halotolerans]|uniref:HTH luxR-type domain-containing protein n=2 Tax=Luteipulveratus halotolerans TaxID=1631356 RepID=A0A0L6CFL9_9MICO|nr:hypothetical protein VV01_04520 [Luteipulveratus halotolerans]
MEPGSHDWAAGIDAIWVGGRRMREGMAELERSCLRTVESVAPTINLAMDPELYALHRRSASRGVRSRSVRERIAPVVLCDSRSCDCNGEFYYGECKGITLAVHVIDRAISVFTVHRPDRESMSIVSSDSRVVGHSLRYLDSIQATSMPMFVKDRRAPLRPTVRQLRILHLMAYGLTDEKVASELKVTSRTVRNDVAALYTMFDVHSRFELGIAYRDWIAGR